MLELAPNSPYLKKCAHPASPGQAPVAPNRNFVRGATLRHTRLPLFKMHVILGGNKP